MGAPVLHWRSAPARFIGGAQFPMTCIYACTQTWLETSNCSDMEQAMRAGDIGAVAEITSYARLDSR
jgi:hypothetical protein